MVDENVLSGLRVSKDRLTAGCVHVVVRGEDECTTRVPQVPAVPVEERSMGGRRSAHEDLENPG